MSYNCFVQRSLKWYRKLFIHLVNMLLLNSYIMFKKYAQEKMSNESFRESIVEALLEDGVQNCNWTLPPLVSNKKEDCSRITERHFPGYIPCALGAKRLRPSRPCYICTNLPQINGVKICRKWTSYWCTDCKKALCIDYCFKVYHTVNDYKTAALQFRVDSLLMQ